MELRPVPLAQVLEGRDGRTYEISGEAALIAARLHSRGLTVKDLGFPSYTETKNAKKKGLSKSSKQTAADAISTVGSAISGLG
jgi:hypothetical protein